MPKRSSLLAVSLSALPLLVAPAIAKSDRLVSASVPPTPQGELANANPIDTPVSGAAVAPVVTPITRPASLEALMAIRPGYAPEPKKSPGRDQAVRQAGWAYGAQGGDAARCFALNEMLRHYAPILDKTYDFRTLVLPAGNNQTMIRPPVVTEAQMAVALDPQGQSARETRRIYQITRKAALVSAVPQWRTWLVRTVTPPQPPTDTLRPRTKHEVEIWRDAVAQGWAAGERQAVEVFLDDLARLERDLVGMARYRVLLNAGKVAPLDVGYLHREAAGGHDVLRINDTEIRIRSQPGLDADRAHWHDVEITRP